MEPRSQKRPVDPMQAKTLLLASLLLLGAVAVAPTASADHYVACSPGSPQACHLVADTVNDTGHYVECYLFTAPVNWLSDCV